MLRKKNTASFKMTFIEQILQWYVKIGSNLMGPRINLAIAKGMAKSMSLRDLLIIQALNDEILNHTLLRNITQKVENGRPPIYLAHLLE